MESVSLGRTGLNVGKSSFGPMPWLQQTAAPGLRIESGSIVSRPMGCAVGMPAGEPASVLYTWLYQQYGIATFSTTKDTTRV